MKVRFLGRSGFLLEWDHCYWLFDYYTGKIPELDTGKRVIVFASHAHRDHWNPRVLDLGVKHPDVHYVLSSDVSLPRDSQVSGTAIHVDPEKEYELADGTGRPIRLTTLTSTDEGVAFLLDYLGKRIYHAGDLNHWVWKGEPEEYNKAMTQAFREQMDRLEGLVIDLAFAPLDPRQEEYYYLGLEGLLEKARVKRVFPMHFGRDFGVIGRYKEERAGNLGETVLMDIRKASQEWEIDL
jgi:L-ascorbate metabolism protein UlaG (beta-lactamase superfamily)